MGLPSTYSNDFHRREEKNNLLRSSPNHSNNASPYKKAISVKERQMELVNFAQDIHIRNQGNF